MNEKKDNEGKSISVFKKLANCIVDLISWSVKLVSVIITLVIVSVIATFFFSIFKPEEVIGAVEIMKSIFIF